MRGDQAEHQVRGLGVEGDVSDLVDHEQVHARKAAGAAQPRAAERFASPRRPHPLGPREFHGGANRIKAAHFPARKTLEEFDFTFQCSARKQVVEHLGQLDFLHGKENVVLLGPLAGVLGELGHGPGRAGAFRARKRWVSSAVFVIMPGSARRSAAGSAARPRPGGPILPRPKAVWN